MPARVRGALDSAQGTREAPLASSTLHSTTKTYSPSQTSLLSPFLTLLPRPLLRSYREPLHAPTESPPALLSRALIRSYREPSNALTETPLCTHVYTRVYTRVYSCVHTCTLMPSHRAPSYALTKSTNSLSKRAHTRPAPTACYVL